MKYNPYDEHLDVNVQQISKYKEAQISTTLARHSLLLNNASSLLRWLHFLPVLNRNMDAFCFQLFVLD